MVFTLVIPSYSNRSRYGKINLLAHRGLELGMSDFFTLVLRRPSILTITVHLLPELKTQSRHHTKALFISKGEHNRGSEGRLSLYINFYEEKKRKKVKSGTVVKDASDVD